MSNKHTPWSRSRHRAGLSADQFGGLDPRVVRGAADRPSRDRPGVAGSFESPRLLGSAAQQSGTGDDTRSGAAVADGDDDPPACPPTRAQGGGEKVSTSSGPQPVPGRSESGSAGYESVDSPVGVSDGYRSAEAAFADTVPKQVPPAPPPTAYPVPPPVAPLERARRDHYARPLPETGSPADTAWPVPESEALELLPVNGHALLGLCIGVAVLLAAGFFYLGRTSGPNHATGPTAATAVSTMAPRETEAPAPTESPDIGAGFAWGKVLTNDGSTLTIKSEINHSEIVVHTDEHTKIYVLVATTIEAIAEGAPLVIYGRKHADGSIAADTITGVSLRALGPG